MKNETVWTSEYFYGNKISEYGLQHGRVDYRTLAKAFDGVLNNDIMRKTWGIIGEWEQESGFVDNTEEIEVLKEKIEEYESEIERIIENDEDYEENHVYIAMKENIARTEDQIEELENEQDYSTEIYQYYIVDDNGARLLEEIDEIVFYNAELDMYVWGVTHWGTSWDYVLTNIKIELNEKC